MVFLGTCASGDDTAARAKTHTVMYGQARRTGRLFIPSSVYPPIIAALARAEYRNISGSDANTTRIGDDGQMPGFVVVEDLFQGRHFDRKIVVLCVRWYLSFRLSF